MLFLSIAPDILAQEADPSFRFTSQPTPTTVSLRGLSVVSDRIAWASGSEATVLRTTDGGTTWEKRATPAPDSVDFRSLKAFSAQEVFVLSAGEPALLYHTTDGGQSWHLRYENRTQGIFFDVLTFWDSTHGIAMSDPVNGYFVLIATHDGGEHWEPLSADHMPPRLRVKRGLPPAVPEWLPGRVNKYGWRPAERRREYFAPKTKETTGKWLARRCDKEKLRRVFFRSSGWMSNAE